jgi:hypothetical protein
MKHKPTREDEKKGACDSHMGKMKPKHKMGMHKDKKKPPMKEK